MPVENTTHERGDQFDATFCTSYGLGQAEKQGQVAINAFFLKNFSSFNAFPSGGDFDQNALAINSRFFVKADDVTSFRDRAFGVEGQASVHFGGDTT